MIVHARCVRVCIILNTCLPKENLFTINKYIFLHPHLYMQHIIIVCNFVCDLVCPLVQELGRLREMQFLEVSENRLESLPAEMGYLTELQDCYLNENLLTELPETFGKKLHRFLHTYVLHLFC